MLQGMPGIKTSPFLLNLTHSSLISDPQEVKLVKKEHFNCWYSLTPYYAALTVSKLPIQVTFNILFSTIVYFMAGVPFSVVRFFAFCLVGNVVSLCAEGFGMMIGSVFNVTVSWVDMIFK